MPPDEMLASSGDDDEQPPAPEVLLPIRRGRKMLENRGSEWEKVD